MKKLWLSRKAYYAYILWRLGRRQILPSYFVNRKRICEKGSPLVDISHEYSFSFDDGVAKRGGFWVRAELVPMLHRAAAALPDGYRLHFFCGWRPMVVQWAAWLDNLENKRKENPNLSDEEIKRIARMTSADPSRGDFGPHQTGGAIDLTVVDKDGQLLDMRTPFLYLGPESQTFYPGITPQQHANQMMLYNVMRLAGFQNYPGEWWHWSYGDRAWAVYQRQRCAIFGEIHCDDYKITPEEIACAEQLANN
ncbi:MAG: hypothetical protein FWE50_02870 [Alphaproteobacteria bacterium]|nr:hypothetical protein [Alphaproteobacteria bacterium]